MLEIVNRAYSTVVKSNFPYSVSVPKQLNVAGKRLNHPDCSHLKFMFTKLKWVFGATWPSRSISFICFPSSSLASILQQLLLLISQISAFFAPVKNISIQKRIPIPTPTSQHP